MTVGVAAVKVVDGATVVVARKAPDGRILPRQVQARAFDGSALHFDFDERGRVARVVRYAPDGRDHVQGFPKGTSLHELGYVDLNKEVQHFLAKNRRSQGAGDVAA